MDTQENQSAFRFTNPVLVESIYMANPDYKGDMDTVGPTNFTIRVQTSQKEKKDNGKMMARVSESVMTNEYVDQSDKTPFYMRVTMSAVFEWLEDEIPVNQIDALLEVNAASLLMSYIRPIVANVTEQAEIQTQHIPFIDFTHAEPQNGKESGEDR